MTMPTIMCPTVCQFMGNSSSEIVLRFYTGQFWRAEANPNDG
jgi:hypothetical protein